MKRTTIKLQQYLAHAGVASRRKSEELIGAGKITVNGKIALIGQRIDPEKDKVKYMGNIITQEKSKYLLLHKPSGYVSTVTDPKKRKTVLDLIPKQNERIYPVGRLDYESEGLILLTNDGDYAYRLTHPKFEVSKTYKVLTKGVPSPEDLKKLERGVYLSDGKTAPAEVELIENNKNSWTLITIHEGRNRQVRRMFELIKHPVIRLIRTKLGPYTLGDLKPGQYKEVDKL